MLAFNKYLKRFCYIALYDYDLETDMAVGAIDFNSISTNIDSFNYWVTYKMKNKTKLNELFFKITWVDNLRIVIKLNNNLIKFLC